MSEQPIMSVSGIRGKAGESLTSQLYTAIAYIQTKYCGAGRMLVGRDTRPSGQDFARAAFRGIRLAGGIPVDLGIAPTPTTCFAVKNFNASGGIIITASHNPHPYNGYKMVHGSGRLFSGSECEQIYRQYHASGFPAPDSTSGADDSPAGMINAAEAHVEKIAGCVNADVIRAAKIKIALDTTNGAAAMVFPLLLQNLQVDWEGVNTGIDGRFSHNPEPRPEHLTELAELLRSRDDFWAGFAFDPDADRLAPMGENGQPLSEELTLALALESALSRKLSPVATNLSTSMMIDDVARKFGAEVIRTRIGEANVVEAMLARGCRIGGEGNGGVIFPEISTVRDGFTALGLILELMANRRLKISALAGQLTSYPIVKVKIPLAGKNPSTVIQSLTEMFQDEKTDTQDGLKIIREYGWVHLRPSNTEPILRCYAEARTEKQANDLVAMVTGKL